jgi:hypothetical protein
MKNIYMRFLSGLLLILIGWGMSSSLYGQACVPPYNVTLSATPAGPQCTPPTLPVNLTVGGFTPPNCNQYVQSVIPRAFRPVPVNFGPNGDDAVGGPYPIGFTFRFYCQDYTQFYISTNGFITLGPAFPPNGCCSGQFFPDPFTPNNVIAGAWDDLVTCVATRYETQGTAPNRVLVVEFPDFRGFGCTCGNRMQIMLYEGTNKIEIHNNIVNLSPCRSFTTQGIENNTGTLATTVPGRNQASWNASDARCFMPQGSVNLVIRNVSNGFNVSGVTNAVDPAPPVGNSTYELLAINPCENCTTTVSVPYSVNPIPNVTINPAGPLTRCTADPPTALTASGATTYSWTPATGLSDPNIANPTANPASTTTYTVTGTTNGCTNSASITITVNTSPTVTVNPNAVTRCSTAPPSALSASGAVSYVWTPATGLSDPNIDNPTANPPSTTTYTVTGTAANGCTGSATVTVTVNNPPTLIANPSVVNRCISAPPSPLFISGAINYSWSPATGLSATNIPNPTANPPSTTTYTVTGTDANGCTNTVNVTVNVSNNLTITISPDVDKCINSPAVQLTAGGATNYTWTPATGLSATNIPNPTANPPSTTTYTVTGSDANGCTGSASVTVTVHPLPNTPTLRTATSPVCPGAFAAQYAVQPEPNTTYLWNVPVWATIIAGQGTDQIFVNWANNTPQSVYIISVTPTANGCAGTPLNIPVFVNPPAPPQPGLISGVTPVCPLQVANYSINAVPTATSYFWSGLPPGANITAGQGTRQITINWGSVAPGSYLINVEAINSCGTSPMQSFVVTVPPVPNTPGMVSPPALHCVGTVATYTATPVAGATSYTWTNSCGWSGFSTTNTIDYIANSQGPCTITVTANNQCFSSTPATITVNAQTIPTQPGFISGNTNICRGAIEVYSIANPVFGVNYTWSGLPFGASITAGQGTDMIVIDWGTANAGAYILTVTPSNACGAGQPRNIPVFIRDFPAQPSPISGTVNVCQNRSSAYSVTPVAGVTYSWSVSPLGPALAPSGNSVEVTWTTPGTYILTVTPNNNCGAGTPRSITVNVSPVPVVDAGPDQIVCGTTATLTGTPNGGTWACELCPGLTQVTNSGNFGLVTGLRPDQPAVFRYTVNDPLCGSFTDYVLVRNDQVVPGQVVNGGNVCSGTNGNLTLVGHTPTATILRWESSTDGFVSNINVINHTTPNYTYTNITQTTQFRAVLQLMGACPEANSGITTVTVTPDQTPMAAPTLQTVCGTTANVNATLPTNGTGTWLFVDGPAPATITTNNGLGIITGLNVPGDYTFRWNIVNAPCPNRFMDVVVRRVSGVVEANAGANQRVCASSTTLIGNNPNGGTGTWSFISGPAAASVTTVGVQGLVTGMSAPGDYVFQWEITEPNCGLVSSSTVMVTVADAPTPAFAGADQTVCGTTATLTGNMPIVGTGTWSYVSGPTIPNFIQSGNSATVVNLNVAGQYVFRYTISNPPCPASFSEVRINKVNPGEPPQVVNTVWNTCSPDFSVQAVAPPSGTGTWSFVSGPAPAAIFTQGTVGLITGMTVAGQYTFRWEVGDPLCGTNSILVVVNKYDDIFPPAFAGANQQICEGTTALLAGSIPPPGAQGVWRFVSGPSVPSFNQFANFASVVNMTAYGDYVFSYSIENPGCTPSVSYVMVTRVARPTIAQAGPSGTICGTSANLRGNVPVHGIGSWMILSMPGGSTPSLFSQGENATVSNMTVPGQYIIRYTIDNPPCPSSSSDVFLTVNPMSDAGLLTTNVFNGCAGSTTGTLTLTNYMGNIVRWEVSTNNFLSLDIIPVQTNTLAFTNLTQTTSYRAVVKQGNCPEAVSNIIRVDVTPIPPVANGGADVRICGDNTLLRGNDPQGAMNLWQFVSSTNGVVPNVTQSGNDAVITGMTMSGDYIFNYSIFNACGLTVDAVVVTVNGGTNPGLLSADATVCRTANTGTLTLTGAMGNVVRWERSTNGFQTFNIIANTNTTFTYNNLTQTTYYRAVVKDGICPEQASNIVEIRVIQPVVANGGVALQTICSDRITLNGNDPAPDGNPTWTQISGNPAAISQSGSRADISGLTAGTYVFQYAIDFGGVCPTSTSNVTVVVSPQTLGGQVDMNTSICSGGNATLTLTGYAGNIVRWERSTNEFQTVLTILNTTPTLNVTNLTQTTSYRAVVKNGSCGQETSLAAVVTVFQPGPPANAGFDQTLCQNSTTVKGNDPGNGIPSWTYISGPQMPNIFSSNENAIVNNLGVGTTVLQYQIDRGPCGITTDQVAITVLDIPNAGLLNGGATYCNSGTGTLTLTGYIGNIVRWEQSTDNFITVQPLVNTNPTLSYNNLTQTTAYRAVVANGVCGEVVSNPVAIVIEKGNYTADAGFDVSTCNSFVTLTGNTPNGMIGTWSVITAETGSNPQLVTNGSQVSITGLTVAGTYVFRYTLSGMVCPPSADDVTVTVLASSVAGTLTANPTAVCEGNNNVTVTLTGQTGTVVRWETSIDNFATFQPILNTSPTLNLTNLAFTTQVRCFVQNGNCGTVVTTPITINVDRTTIGGEVLFNQTVCSGTNGGTLTLTGYRGNIVRWETSLDGITWTPIANTSPSQTFVNLTQNTQYRAVVQSGVCAPQNSGVATVFVAPPPVAGTLSSDAVICQFTGTGTLTLTGHVGQIQRWEVSTDPTFQQNVSFINTNLTTLNYSNLSQTSYYRVLIGAPNCGSIFTNTVTITVISPATAGTVTQDATVCSGTNNGTLVLSNFTGSVIRWESSTDCVNFATTIGNVSTNQSYSNLTQTTCFRAVVSNGICPPSPSGFARITVVSPSVGGTVTGGTSVCTEGNAGLLTLTGHTGNVIAWEYSTECTFFSNPILISNTTPFQSYANLTQTTCYRAIVQNGPCAVASSAFATVTVVANPNPGFIVGNVGGCAGQTSGILSLIGNTAPVVRWERSFDNQNWGNPIITTESNLAYNNLTQTTYYRAVVRLSNCPEIVSGSVEITVTQPPLSGTVTGGGNTVCFGSNSGTLTLSGNTGTIARWEASTDNGITWISIPVTNNTYTYNNLTQTTRFRAVVQSGVCTAVFSNSVVVTVSPPLELSAQSVTGCSGGANITATATGGNGFAGYTYTLFPIGNTNNTGQFNNVSAGTYTILVRDGLNCTASINVTVSPASTPTFITSFQNITTSSALVTWASVPGALSYNLRYRILGETTWTTLTGLTAPSRLLTGLQNNTTYEVEVQYVCSGGFTSPFSNTGLRNFTTLPMGTGDCATSSPSNVPVPGGIYISSVTNTTARVHWNRVPNAAGYIISFGLISENPNNYTQVIVCDPTTSYLLTSLQPNTQYRVRVRTNCSNCITALNNNDLRSVWSSLFGFTTPATMEENVVGLTSANDVVIYPNPNKGNFTIQLAEAIAGTAEIFDLTGRKVAHQTITDASTQMNLEGLSAGVYTLRLRLGDEAKVLKVVIE